MNLDLLLPQLAAMSGTKLSNYVLPGLTSTLIDKGQVRLFEASRHTEEHITPHSHRFDFACLVLRGWVENTLYVRDNHELNDWYETSNVEGQLGNYTIDPWGEPVRFKRYVQGYQAGDVYAMTNEEIHSIKFSKDAIVLFFEGPPVKQVTQILEPLVDGKRVPTFRTAPWMFQPK